MPSTFYYWIRKLQQRACYTLPETVSCKESVPVASARQDVACINIQPDPVHEMKKIDTPGCPDATTVALQYGGVRIALADDFNEQTLKRVLLTLWETLC